MALSPAGDDEEDDETTEDKINRLMEAKKMLANASYFAFTATPKNKTLEIFGEPVPQADGTVKHVPFHSYTMKQADQEGFILDVPEALHARRELLPAHQAKEDDPDYDTKRAEKKLRRYVESHDHAIRLKAEIMVDHFHEQVLALNKIGGQARAMVVTDGIERAIQYYHAISEYLRERKSPYRAIVAFSGEHEYGGTKVTEASLNGFPSSQIADKIQEDPYRFLVCADKFQTGYDEPLLHTMYVDKVLSGIKAVQTLSRLNRAHQKKHDVFVLDFMNDPDVIEAAFADYYRTTILAEETDPNKLHDLKDALDAYQVYADAQVDLLVSLYLDGADRDTARSDSRRQCGGLPGAAGRGRPGGLQRERQGVHTHVWLPRLDPAVHEGGVGKALDLPELPDPEVACARGTGSVKGDPRSHRHGQLPPREAGDLADPAPGRERGDRARPHLSRR